MHADRRRFFSCISRLSRLHSGTLTRPVTTGFSERVRRAIFESMNRGLPNQSVERTGARASFQAVTANMNIDLQSVSAPLAPVAHLYR